MWILTQPLRSTHPKCESGTRGNNCNVEVCNPYPVAILLVTVVKVACVRNPMLPRAKKNTDSNPALDKYSSASYTSRGSPGNSLN